MQEKQICWKRYMYIICGYLLVFILLVSYMTWARYQRTVEGKMNFPEAKGFTASMELGGTLDISSRLTDLLPSTRGDEGGKYLDFTVLNSSPVPDAEGTGSEGRVVSETDLDFSLCIYSTGNLPLELRLVELGQDDVPEGPVYTAERSLAANSKTWGERYQYHFPSAPSSGNGTVEKRFQLEAGAERQKRFRIYFDWAGDGIGEAETSVSRDLLADAISEAYKKEVELMEIRSVVSAQPEKASYDTAPTAAAPGGEQKNQ